VNKEPEEDVENEEEREISEKINKED